MKVGIQNKEGSLILVWNNGKRRTMAIAQPDKITPLGEHWQKRPRLKLNGTGYQGCYDPTLLKYRPIIMGKNSSELTMVELFRSFTKHQQKTKGLAQSLIDTGY